MKKLTTFMITAAAMALASPVLAQTTVTVFAPSTNTDPGVWFENDVRPGGTASIADLTGDVTNIGVNQPLPIGAAKLTTDFTDDATAKVGVLNDYGMPDDIFSTLGILYSYHKAANVGQNPAAAPALKLAFFNTVCDGPASAGDCFGTLVYEPTWNGPGSTSAVPLGSNPAVDVWTDVVIDENTGLFWWTGGFGFDNSFGGPPLKTLAEWHSAFPSDFGDATLVAVSIGVGSFNQGQVGYFDDVQISHLFGGGFSESYDFEPAPLFETLGECVSTLIADQCTALQGRARANCNHDQQMICFDIFDIP